MPEQSATVGARTDPRGPFAPHIASKLNDIQAEMVVVASNRVIDATEAMMVLIMSDKYSGEVSSQQTPAKRYDTHRRLISPPRLKVAGLMRKDMLPWWRPRSRTLDSVR